MNNTTFEKFLATEYILNKARWGENNDVVPHERLHSQNIYLGMLIFLHLDRTSQKV